jgi:hypothetical protein
MTTITLKLNKETELPQNLIDDAPKQGSFDAYAEYILDTYDIDVSLQDSIAYLKRFGAWESDELQDLETNKARLMWIACLDCKEQKTTDWYMGE